MHDDLKSLERHSRRLETAYSLIQEAHGNLSLDQLVEGVVTNFVEVAGFSGAEIRLEAVLDGFELRQAANAGVSSGDPALTRTTPVFIRGVEIGTIVTHFRTYDQIEEQSELLESVLPTLFLGIDNAVSFAEVLDYRATLEKRVEERTAELNAAHAELSRTVEDLRETRLSRDRFFANINHEIRTPLTLIQLAAEAVMTSRGAPPAVRDRGEEIQFATRRLLHLVNGLLQLAAGHEGKLQVRPRAFDTAKHVRHLVSSWTTAAKKAHMDLVFDGPETCPAQVDEAALDTVVGNLVSNAVKFTPAHGRVTVAMRADDQLITISVRDTGVGIDPDFVPKLFSRFERSTSTAGIRGSGIGLALAKDLVELQQGKIRVIHHDDPRGTEFEVSIPRYQTIVAIIPDAGGSRRARPVTQSIPSMLQPEAEVAVPTVTNVTAAQPSATIVLAEDDIGLAKQISAILGSQYRVLVAHDGKAALALASRERPDLLVTDLDMPGMDGVELTRRFLELEGMSLSPVLMVSAHAGLSDRLASFDAGVVDYVIKPFSSEELLARIRSQLAIRQLALRLHENEKLAAMGIMSAGLAHELRNPANAIINAIEPLLMLLPDQYRAPDSAGAVLSEVIMTATVQLRDRCNSILDFSRTGTVLREPEDLGTMIARSRRVLHAKLEEIQVIEQLEVTEPVQCAAVMIEQVLVNLLDNAAYAAGSGGTIWISAQREGGLVGVEIRDSGPGVPPALRERIFDPFYTTKPVGVGTGLGLSISRRIALDHGGDLRVVARGETTAFRLEISQPA